MVIRIDLTSTILAAISAHVSNKRALRKTEFVVIISGCKDVQLYPSFCVRTYPDGHRATVDVIEHILADDVAEFREHMEAISGDNIIFTAYPSKWKYCFGNRKCRRWVRID